MSEHHPKNVSAVSKWCPTCRRNTLHRVDFKREGSCTEHAASGLSREQERRQRLKEQDEQNPKFEF